MLTVRGLVNRWCLQDDKSSHWLSCSCTHLPLNEYHVRHKRWTIDRLSRTNCSKMNDMSGLVFIVQQTRLFWISEELVIDVEARTRYAQSPQICLWWSSKDPCLAFLLSESRANGFSGNDILDSLSYETWTASDEDGGNHDGEISIFSHIAIDWTREVVPLGLASRLIHVHWWSNSLSQRWIWGHPSNWFLQLASDRPYVLVKKNLSLWLAVEVNACVAKESAHRPKFTPSSTVPNLSWIPSVHNMSLQM